MQDFLLKKSTRKRENEIFWYILEGISRGISEGIPGETAEEDYAGISE